MGRSKVYQLVLLACSILIVCYACNPKALSPDAYINWYHQGDNDLTQSRSVDDIEVSIMYLSDDYLAIRNSDEKEKSSPEQLKQEAEHFQDLIYFKLKVAMKDGQKDLLQYQLHDESEYNKRIQYYSFMLKDDLKLIAGGDTLPCAMHNFERSYGLSPYVNFLIAFEKKQEISSDLHLVFNERVYNSGPMHFTLKEKAIKRIPHLKL